ncbi:MAG: ribonuclease HII [Chloroflexi bacterium]|jgi:ribonuclease HII|nr:MAG: ribonuclease HII [Chloroflexota bacterium]
MRRLRDSKALTALQRADLATILREESDWGIGVVSSEQIDRVGIVEGTRQAMLQALASLSTSPDHVLLDGRPVYLNGRPTRSIIRGDALCISISAASIVAKVARDAMMEQEENSFPGYGFAKHKGYGTRAHMEALSRLGPCPIHRRSFAPVRESLPIAPNRGFLA